MKGAVKLKKNDYEKQAWQKNKLAIGIDEVGRGCLAGPVVTAAVIIPIGQNKRFFKDSKILTEPQRIEAATWIMKHCYWATSLLNNRIIDEYNIYQSTLMAMKKALVHLLAKYQIENSIDSVLVDAMPLNLSDTHVHSIPIYHFPFGETYSSSIAAASIIAKITRDALMKKFEPLFPGYHLAQHKGYCTPQHKAAIREINHTIIHRMRFLKKIRNVITYDNYEEQQTIC